MIPSPVSAPLRITQHFGQNPEEYKKYGIAGHDGVDFTGEKAGKNVYVYSPYDGKVTERGFDPVYGNFIRIVTPVVNGRRRELIFAHLGAVSVSKGEWVHLGEKIAIMGNTGHSTGVHLHLGLRYLSRFGRVLDRDNRYNGYVNFEPYLMFWLHHDHERKFVSYPYG